MMSARKICLALCLLGWGGWSLVSAQTYEELCERASTAISRDSLAQAERYIRQALSLDPANVRNALLFANLGTVQRMRHRYKEALESYSYAVNMASRNPLILQKRADLYLEMGELEKARMDYALVLDLQPDNQEALEMRAYIYSEQQDYKAARVDYERLLTLSPQHFSGRLGLAMLNQKEGKLKEALAILDGMVNEKGEGTSLLTAPQHAVVYVARAGVQQELGRQSMALMDLEEAIRLDDSRPEAYLMRGQIYLSQEKKKQAREDFEKALALGIPLSDLTNLLEQCR